MGVMGYGWEEALDTPMPFLVAGQRGRVKYDSELLQAAFGSKNKGPRRAGSDEPVSLKSKSALLNWAQRTNSRFQPKAKRSDVQQ